MDKKTGVPITHSGLSRRKVIKTGLAAGVGAALPTLFNINHAFSKEVVYNGEVFDAGGATINIGEWGGFWEEFVRGAMVGQFEKDFNCKVVWESSWPWFPKFVTNGAKNPVFDVCNWNLPELTKTAKAGDFFTPADEVRENVPNAKDCWDFAFASNTGGVTWGYGPYVYAYRSDLAKPAPGDFKSFWEAQYANKRGTYVTTNGLYHCWFMATAKAFGKDQYDMEAAFKAIEDAMPLKISEFTGNMLQLLDRGEATIAVHLEGEALSMKDKGKPIDVWEWDNHAILTQTKTISRYSNPMQKKLAYALLNRTLSPDFLKKFGDTFYMRPTNSKAPFNALLEKGGARNTADATKDFWIPDWNFFVDNEAEIVERSNEIFGL